MTDRTEIPAVPHDIKPVKKSPGRRKSIALVGSYEESLFSCRMSSSSSHPVSFNARLGMIGTNNEFPPHLATNFEAVYYDWGLQDNPRGSTPYVGHIDVEQLGEMSTDLRIPRQGQLQVIISNMENTPVHLFLIPYDLSEMPGQSKTFLRQKEYEVAMVNGEEHRRLTHAVHISIVCPRKKKIYINGEIRVVFENRTLRLGTENRIETVLGHTVGLGSPIIS